MCHAVLSCTVLCVLCFMSRYALRCCDMLSTLSYTWDSQHVICVGAKLSAASLCVIAKLILAQSQQC